MYESKNNHECVCKSKDSARRGASANPIAAEQSGERAMRELTC